MTGRGVNQVKHPPQCLHNVVALCWWRSQIFVEIQSSWAAKPPFIAHFQFSPVFFVKLCTLFTQFCYFFPGLEGPPLPWYVVLPMGGTQSVNILMWRGVTMFAALSAISP